MTTRPPDSTAEGPPSIRQLPSFPAATLTTRGPYWKLSPTFTRLRRWLTAASVQPTDCALALFFDDPAVTPAERCRYSVCYPVSDADAVHLAATQPMKDAPAARLSAGPPAMNGVEMSAPRDDVYEIKTFPSAEAAVVEYAGPADRSPAVYARLEQWIEAQGLEPDGPPRERYLAEPGSLGKGMMHVEVQQPVSGRPAPPPRGSTAYRIATHPPGRSAPRSTAIPQ